MLPKGYRVAFLNHATLDAYAFPFGIHYIPMILYVLWTWTMWFPQPRLDRYVQRKLNEQFLVLTERERQRLKILRKHYDIKCATCKYKQYAKKIAQTLTQAPGGFKCN